MGIPAEVRMKNQYLTCLEIWVAMIVIMFILTINNIGIAHYTGFSMCPTYNTEGIMIMQKTNEVSVGDVVTFPKKGMFVNHRIVGVLEDELIIEPDSLKPIQERGWTAKQDIVNKSDIIEKNLFIVNYPWKPCPDFSKMTLHEYNQLWHETYD